MNKKKILISLSLNAIIIVLTIIGLGIAVIDIQSHPDHTYASLFQYFTTLSNIFLFATATIMLVCQVLLVVGKIKSIPKWISIVKLCATVSTTITMLVVIFFLTPVAASGQFEEIGPAELYTGSNAIFHVISPTVGIVAFLLFETNHEIKLPQTLFSLIFVAGYELFYTIDYYVEFMPWGHDWYKFIEFFGQQFAPLILIAFLGFTFLLAWLLWLGNRKINIFKEKTATR